ncbi:TraR/DksA family transcriptional regulator [Chromobacterium subtsugae]|uniref:TraR/DksA family transcriptional regulator n=2 Tax=Chromobacterium subtsugae TaxID=251747 RepID=A0ABS7FJU9_9NEIS|nr:MULTISPECIES: TraR/DksA family transcriptional regulator [Chromobacterium]MBW7568662.1 TraR/DksA family transcriptional regulator [Chromobacterium subtsugae]MBW8290332.1 TraR/DksA family transcriptional regulator [Chromobacterium subtsugae]WSE93646.1 TraR/DksA family transcriptional regulator [Chromobacterium subtsugae]WVH62023.1 TraR/DksA family transcriptional regulator [Chromobacterium subtsugae]
MTDLFDQAQALEQRQREEALARQAVRMNLAGAASYSHCQECGDDIPASRRRAVPGCRRCLICQKSHEKGWC